MKSIKGKAKEYAREFVEPFVLYYTKDEVRQFEAQHEDSFEAGANYVFDKIEMLLPKEDKNLNDCGKALIWRIKDTIEQLKSNQ